MPNRKDEKKAIPAVFEDCLNNSALSAATENNQVREASSGPVFALLLGQALQFSNSCPARIRSGVTLCQLPRASPDQIAPSYI
jgi:hypothetical protein